MRSDESFSRLDGKVGGRGRGGGPLPEGGGGALRESLGMRSDEIFCNLDGKPYRVRSPPRHCQILEEGPEGGRRPAWPAAAGWRERSAPRGHGFTYDRGGGHTDPSTRAFLFEVVVQQPSSRRSATLPECPVGDRACDLNGMPRGEGAGGAGPGTLPECLVGGRACDRGAGLPRGALQ